MCIINTMNVQTCDRAATPASPLSDRCRNTFAWKSGNWIRAIPLLTASIPVKTPNRSACMQDALWHARCIRLCFCTAISLPQCHRSCRNWSSDSRYTPASSTSPRPCARASRRQCFILPTPQRTFVQAVTRWAKHMLTSTRSGTSKTLRKIPVKP